MTNVYMLRAIGTKEIHGVFWSPNRQCLFQSVDEMASPFLFEFAKLPAYGGVWTEDVIGDGCNDLLFTVSSETILEAAYSQGNLKWKRFKKSDLWGDTSDEER